MTTQPSHHTFADYLALERDSEIRHEYDAGEILAMPGGTARHSALAIKVLTAMETTRARGCTVFTCDLRVRIAPTGRATYPDVSMVCGPIEYDPEDAARTTITNPVLLVEVLSVTTEKGDRGNKWMHYQRIPSLQEYVLVSQDARVEIFRRTPSGTWEYSEVRDGNVRLASRPTLDLAVLTPICRSERRTHHRLCDRAATRAPSRSRNARRRDGRSAEFGLR